MEGAEKGRRNASAVRQAKTRRRSRRRGGVVEAGAAACILALRIERAPSRSSSSSSRARGFCSTGRLSPCVVCVWEGGWGVGCWALQSLLGAANTHTAVYCLQSVTKSTWGRDTNEEQEGQQRRTHGGAQGLFLPPLPPRCRGLSTRAASQGRRYFPHLRPLLCLVPSFLHAPITLHDHPTCTLAILGSWWWGFGAKHTQSRIQNTPPFYANDLSSFGRALMTFPCLCCPLPRPLHLARATARAAALCLSKPGRWRRGGGRKPPQNPGHLFDLLPLASCHHHDRRRTHARPTPPSLSGLAYIHS
jgi:hypothetical protein